MSGSNDERFPIEMATWCWLVPLRRQASAARLSSSCKDRPITVNWVPVLVHTLAGRADANSHTCIIHAGFSDMVPSLYSMTLRVYLGDPVGRWRLGHSNDTRGYFIKLGVSN